MYVPLPGPAGDPLAAWGQATGWRDFRGPASGAQPVVPQRPRPQPARPWTGPSAGAPPPSTGPVLIGVVDNGCPFAHRLLRRADGGTRVLSLWDQDPYAPAFTTAGGGAPAAGGGCVIHRAALDALCRLGEAGAYRAAGYHAVRHVFGHGAAVLDLLCGPVPLTERLTAHAERPPRWRATGDAASQADVVFVQLPRDLVQDSSSAALEPAVLAGIDHVMRCAGPDTKTVVVNVSDGSSRGPHDGSADFDAEVRARVHAAKQHLGITLHVVVPAGNSWQERRHAWLPAGPAAAPVVLQVPPGNETAVFVTARLPRGAGVELRLRPLHATTGAGDGWVHEGQAKGWRPGPQGAPVAAVFWPAGAATAMLAWSPTHTETPDAAPHGPWVVEVRAPAGAPVAGGVDLWVSRCARNATALPRSVQPHFVDTDGGYDPARHLRERVDDPVPAASALRREGSLNALATGAAVWVAGGARARDARVARYSAGGRVAADPPAMRGPDLLAVTDLSRTVPGVPAAGNHGGSTVRVIGTSFAAPQLARALANGAWPPLAPVTEPPARAGRGALPPAAAPTSAPAASAGTPATAPPARRSRRPPAPS